MRNILCPILFLFMLTATHSLKAQETMSDTLSYDIRRAYIVGQSVHRGETIPHIKLPTYYAYAPIIFKSKRQRNEYDRLVRDVKRVLPLAAEIRGIIIETYETLQLLPDDKARERHIDKLEKELKDVYTPKMKKLTLRQGKLLIKLVDRECNQNAYQLIKLFMGSFKAVFYNAFASMFGASLKKSYDPAGDDWMTEQVVVKVLTGQL
ncbi:MAG: DUF4294 domain-containing protein [Bacteroidaceae bacterium]|nr:DUF4294 domain-containing protein [Bacteroidaceae bacterium]